MSGSKSDDRLKVTRPDPGFVVKCRAQNGMKVFLNITSSGYVEKPHNKTLMEFDGEEGIRVPLSIGDPKEDFDKKKTPCVTYDLVANPDTVEECANQPEFKATVIQLCMSAVQQKHKVPLEAQYKLPKIKYKGGSLVTPQRIKVKKESDIQEVLGETRQQPPQPGGSAALREAIEAKRRADEEEKLGGIPRPDFRVVYVDPGKDGRLPDNLAERDLWSWRPESGGEEQDGMLHGFDLACYQPEFEFRAHFKGSMKKEFVPGEEAEKAEQSWQEPKREKSHTLYHVLHVLCLVVVHAPVSVRVRDWRASHPTVPRFTVGILAPDRDCALHAIASVI